MIGDTGEVAFVHQGRRYLGGPGAPARDIGFSIGSPRWFKGAWYVVIGNTPGNGRLGPNQATTFSLTATGGPGSPVPTCTSP